MSFFKKLFKGNKKDDEKKTPVKQAAPVNEKEKARQEENRKKMEAMYAQTTPTPAPSSAPVAPALPTPILPPEQQRIANAQAQAQAPVSVSPTTTPNEPKLAATPSTPVSSGSSPSTPVSPESSPSTCGTNGTEIAKQKVVFAKKNVQVLKEKLRQAKPKFVLKPKALKDSVLQMQHRMKAILDVCKEVNMMDVLASKKFYINRNDVFKNAGEKVGVQIWRIVRMIPILVPEHEHGKFYTGDCYIVLKTNEAQHEEERLRRLHMWMGRNANMRKRAICAYLAWELSSKLQEEDRKAHHFGEEDTEESSTFREYFRKIEPLEGEASSETLRPVEKSCYEERMIRIVVSTSDGRPVAMRDLFPRRNDFGTVAKDEDVLLLIGNNNIFVWLGKESAQPFQIKALDIAAMIFSEERKGRDCTVQLVNQGSEPDQFWKLLQTVEEEEEEEEQQLSVSDEKKKEEDMELLFEIIFDEKEKNVVVEKIEQRPLVRKMLNSQRVYLLVTKYEVYKWYGLKSNQESRRYGRALGTKLIKHGRALYNYSAFEGCEPVLFQDRFTTGFYMIETPITYEERRIRFTNIMLGKLRDDVKGKFDTKEEEETKKALSYMDPKDDGSGTIHMFRVVDSKTAEPVKEEEIGHFYSNESYLIVYLYNRGEAEEEEEDDEEEEESPSEKKEGNKDEKTENIENTKEILRANKAKKKKINYLTRRILYAWEGPMSNENIYSRMLKKNFKGLCNAKKNPALLINTSLGKEDEHFLKIFGHKMVIHKGDREEKSEKALYRIFSNSVVNSRAVQVDCKRSSLNSNNVYLLISGKNMYMWLGQFTTSIQKKIANKFATSLNEDPKRTVVEVFEGKESKQYWNEFEPQEEEEEGEQDYVKQKHDYTRGTVYEIFITTTNYRVMDAAEVGKGFTCHDLDDCHNIHIFDFKHIIYVWHPREPLDSERKIGQKVAKLIAKNDDDEDQDSKQILEIHKGKEPMGFKHGFVQWEEKEPFEDIFVLKREHSAKRQAQKVSKCLPFLKVMREKYPQLLTDDEHVNIYNIVYMVDLARQLENADKLLKKIGQHKIYKFTPQFAAAVLKFAQDNFPPLKKQ